MAANTLVCLIHQTNYLLDQQLRALEKAFLKEGGFTERLYRTRTQKTGTLEGAMSYTEDNLIMLSALAAFCLLRAPVRLDSH